MKNNKKYYIYILECTNGAYYTGYTTDIDRRYQEHVFGTDKCKYTRAFPPVKLAACWEINSANVSAVLKIEKQIKALFRNEKAKLISEPKLLLNLVSADIGIKNYLR